jgi:hypothetical protein
VEEQWMVSEEIKSESYIDNSAPENHALWRLLMSSQTGMYARNQGNFFAKAKDFSCHGHAAFKFE